MLLASLLKVEADLLGVKGLEARSWQILRMSRVMYLDESTC